LTAAEQKWLIMRFREEDMNIKCSAIITAAALGALLATAASASAGEVSGISNGRGRVSITPLEGCDASRPAVAHGTDRIPVSVQPAYAPIPCQTVIGLSSEDADVGVTRSGALFYAPLVQNTSPPPQNTLEGPENVVRSDNGGASWGVLDSGGPTTGGLVPPWMGVDRETERIWFATTFASLCGARISWSDDEGNRWQTNPSVGCPAEGANKVLEGPPPRGGARPVHYPHVVYYCANSNDAGGIVYCYRSLDGGKTFSFVGNPDPELPSGCVETHPARTGVVGPDGVLYFPTQLCDASGAPNSVLGIAISRDEGATWTQRTIAATQIQNIYIQSTAVDADGNLYIAWTGPSTLPYLTISRDRGSTWSTPIPLAAPGITQVRTVAIAARRPGEIALAYQGTTDGTNFNGYITSTADALAKRPLYWSATVNDPAEPLVNGSNSQTFGDRILYLTDVIGPDGSVWAGFHCAETAACLGQRLGVMGRLAPNPFKRK
jgi:hypothetical protein